MSDHLQIAFEQNPVLTRWKEGKRCAWELDDTGLVRIDLTDLHEELAGLAAEGTPVPTEVVEEHTILRVKRDGDELAIWLDDASD